MPEAEPTTGAHAARHTMLVRVTHWINAIAFFFLVVSGGGILLAHPELYWGETGYFGKEPAFSLGIATNVNHTDWGRNFHFLFAWIFVLNGLVYIGANAVNEHIRRRLLPTRQEVRLRCLLADIRSHFRLRMKSAVSVEYNVLQKYAYLIVIFLICPLILLTGLAMSPAVTAAFPELLTVFGGRQSARTVHFILANLLTLFLIVHVIAVLRSGARNLTRSMITGRYVLEE